MAPEASALGIALLGCGTVGAGVAEMLLRLPDRWTERCGRRLELRGLLVANPAKPRPPQFPGELFTTDGESLVRARDVSIVVELLGGTDLPRRLILAAFAAGKDVVTANKAVLAEHGDELLQAARNAGRTLCFEGSVGGGIPLLLALTQGLAANRILSIKAILNGTSNFILTQMSERNQDYRTALLAAQQAGFAEADPTLDVNGTDSAQKLAILARLAFGARLTGADIERRGIAELASADIEYADQMGCVIKLLAEGWLEDEELALHVEPTLIRKHEPLAEVRGAFNAIEIIGDAVGRVFLSGHGAGQQPTASAVVGDILAIAQGCAGKAFLAADGYRNTRTFPRRPADRLRSRFYLRLSVGSQLGVLAEIDNLLAGQGISIASLVSHEPPPGGPVPVVIMTHSASLGAVRRAVQQLCELASVVEPPVYYPIAD